MGKFLKVKILEDIDSDMNDSVYYKNQIIKVIELSLFDDSYAYYYEIKQQGEVVQTLDWIPKYLCEVIEELKS